MGEELGYGWVWSVAREVWVFEEVWVLVFGGSLGGREGRRKKEMKDEIVGLGRLRKKKVEKEKKERRKRRRRRRRRKRGRKKEKKWA